MATIESEVKRARAIRDPLKRAVAIQDLYRRVQALTLELADERGKHILAAHAANYSYGVIAAEMGVSKPRVQQLIRPKKSRAKVKPTTPIRKRTAA